LKVVILPGRKARENNFFTTVVVVFSNSTVNFTESHAIMVKDFGIPVPSWYQGYVNSLGNRNFIEVLRENLQGTPAVLLGLQQDLWDYAYAPGKWTVKEVLIHLTDCERIFCYRALRFARNDKTELPGFDENEYAPNCFAHKRSETSIIEEYKAVRNATLTLFENFDSLMMTRTGTANGNEFSVSMIGAIIAGHEIHHKKILQERYGIMS
jgi:hypothetical protein